MTEVDAIVLFSGPGGSTLGVRRAGITNSIGVEFDPSFKGDGVQPAVATARAAGFMVEQSDVRTLDPKEIHQRLSVAAMGSVRYLLLQASPPCQGLSMAGKGEGRKDLDKLLEALEEIGRMDMASAARWTSVVIAWLVEECSDARSPLTFEVIRWIATLNPEFVQLEQVPAALPIWEAIAKVLEAWGYSVWCGNVQAEQFGVPQTRKRAVLSASRISVVTEPVPTHSKYHNRDPKKLDEGVEKWVSMAEALGWGMVQRPSYTVTGGGTASGGAEVFASGGAEVFASGARKGMTEEQIQGRWIHPSGEEVVGEVSVASGPWEPTMRDADAPAPTVMFGARLNTVEWQVDRDAVRAEVEPRVNNQSGTEFDLAWPADRPAPVIAGRDLVTMPGANANRFNGSTKSRNDGIRVTVEEAGVLQSFPADWPWTGTKTARFQQVGNAVPPQLQSALTASLLAGCVTWGKEEEAVTA